ncbi:hypothetical protein B0J14DRAFT_123428 [Halenospora varia]|nr:hypothetical protein B0J14DRAFT_123428 [Halenospora varia]
MASRSANINDLLASKTQKGGSQKARAKRPKVRTGCFTCKVRRVKCDETRPYCCVAFASVQIVTAIHHIYVHMSHQILVCSYQDLGQILHQGCKPSPVHWSLIPHSGQFLRMKGKQFFSECSVKKQEARLPVLFKSLSGNA